MNPPAPRQFGETTAPPSAFRIPIDCRFLAGDRKDNRTPIEMLARSAEPVQHWYWGAIYHDFGGMTRRDSIPIDYCHDDAEIIGVGSSFEVGDDGLKIGGHLVHLQQGDRVDTITQLSAAGVPFEASIDFRGEMILEEVPAGFVSAVNGRAIEGPALIVREWTLRGVAVCPHGMDPNTSSQFARDDTPIALTLISPPVLEGTMTKTTTTTGGKTAGTPAPALQQSEAKPDAASAAPASPTAAQQQVAAASDSPPAAAPAADQEGGAKFRAELKKFTDKFGEKLGTQWFLENKTWAEACEAHAEELGRRLAAKEAEVQQLASKLKSLHHGEEIPASLGQDPQEQTADGQGTVTNRFAHMGKIGAFASALTIPKR